VEVSPSAHFIMGGVRIDSACRSTLSGLYAAGEDAGGVHGANRLGGNGVAESIVFGGIAGESLAGDIVSLKMPPVPILQAERMMKEAMTAVGRTGSTRITAVRSALRQMMWDKVGLVRDERGLSEALGGVREFRQQASAAAVAAGLVCNMDWHTLLDVRNCLDVAEAIILSATHRRESRGSHYRSDFPERDNSRWLINTLIQRDGDSLRLTTRPVALTRLKPAEQKP
jgi:succinate dehydrogenase/fumarate reductase flavoprotein subunit